MVWYEGTISQAIKESKDASKLFVVYITGKNEESKKMDEIWRNDCILDMCRKHCVCLRLENDSPSSKQFAQIYPVLTIPAVFLIGDNGLPLEVIGETISSNDLAERLGKAVQQKRLTLSNNDSNAQKSAATSTTDEASHPSTSATTISSLTTGFSDEESLNLNDVAQSQHGGEPSTLVSKPAGEEEKQAQAKVLQEKMNQRRLEKLKQAEEEERLREIERRELGKQMQEIKEKQEDFKRKREIEQRQKEKQLEKEALERVRQQIVRDREEKAKRFQEDANVRRAAAEEKRRERERLAAAEEEARAREREQIARIQFRLPDGSALNRQYSRDSTLRSCMDDLSSNRPVGLPEPFQLSTSIPRRVFTDEDEEKTLTQLDLVPSASIFVRPKVTSKQNKASGRSLFGQLFSLVVFTLSLPFNIISYLWGFIFGSSKKPQPSVTSSPPSPSAGYSAATSSNSYAEVRRRRDVASKSTKRDGNMHRLHDVKKDDDDSATWNGNSTQQM